MKTSQLAGVPKLGGIEGGLGVVAGEQADEGLKETEGGLSGEDARAGFDDDNGAQSGGAAAGCDGCGKVEVGTGGSTGGTKKAPTESGRSTEQINYTVK